MIETGVLFGDVHSFYDLGLILSPFTPTPAAPKTTYQEIPGGNGSLDLSEVHGEIKYSDRAFSFTFTVNAADPMPFDEKVSQVSNALNGKRCKITLDRDPAYFWEGRCTVDAYKQDGRLKQVSVSAKVKPYKYKQEKTVKTVDLTTESQEITLYNGRLSVVPVFECTADTAIIFNGTSYAISTGTHKILDIRLTEGANTLTVSGSGTLTITYQEGEL